MHETFGDRVRRLRRAKGLKQQQLADETGYARAQTVGAWEKNTAHPSSEGLVRVARVLGVSPEVLLHGEEGIYREAFETIEAVLLRARRAMMGETPPPTRAEATRAARQVAALPTGAKRDATSEDVEKPRRGSRT